jgi:hypothetical protein
MLGCTDTRRMLRQIEADNCLPDAVTAVFLDAVEIEINSLPLPAGETFRVQANWAKGCVLAALGKVAPQVCVSGPEIAASSFAMLARIRPARDYRWCLPIPARQAFFNDFGIGNDDWTTADDGQLRTWIEEHQVDYDGPIETGGRSGPAFVTDVARLPVPTPTFEQFQDLLGLVFADRNRTLGLLWRYPRTALTAQGYCLCLPRSLDGLDYAPFAMEEDCAAPHGRARRPNGEFGLPEAIHYSCQIPSRPVISLELIS